jgi:putative aminopeptidase FrvX
MPFSIDRQYLLETLRALIAAPSPTGDAGRGVQACVQILHELDLDGAQFAPTRKGDLLVHWAGENDNHARALTAHIDTLGAVVSRIYPNGRLQLAQIGSYFWSAIENENVRIETSSGQMFTGTVFLRDFSYHSHLNDGAVDDRPRSAREMDVRIDAVTNSSEETRRLGIEVGDYVHFEPRYEEHNGFIKSRFLDDKACLACVFAAFKALKDSGRIPRQRLTLQIGAYEEVMHGGGTIPNDVWEVLALDIAPLHDVGNSSEFGVSLCILDKDGPNDRQFSLRLQRLAREHDIDLRPDIFARYSSDGKAFWHAGGNAQVALIGPGTDATHGYERTHIQALEQTALLLVHYLLSD